MTAQDLKNSILQLAVQGKLVPQDPSDEPASELLKRIQAEKAKLIKDGKTKKEKPSPVIADEEKPFDIPDSWAWLRLGDFCCIYNGNSINTQEKEQKYAKKCEGYSFIATKDVGFNHIIDYENGIYIPYGMEEFKIAPNGSILMCMEGGSAGRKIGILEQDVCFGNKLCCFTSISVFNKYLYYFLQTPIFFSLFTGLMTGIIGGVGAAKIKSIIMPLPPLAEQERIVAKIEELMPLVEEYGKTEERIKALNAEFPDKLRKSILQQAVQGKLTERDPSDEPASELLKRIRAEKAKLIAEGKIKKEKPLPPITDEEKPFDIPDTWEWERVGNLFSVIRGSSPRPKGSPLYWSSKETEFHWVTIKDISDHTQNGVMYKTHEYLTELGSALSTYVEKGELIVAVSGSTTGKFCVLGINGFIYDGLAAVLNPIKIISSEYLKVFYSWVYQILNSKKIGSAFPNINTDVLKNTLIPIPPLAEQKRIVARVEELLAVCDGLK